MNPPQHYDQSLNIIECWLDTRWKLDSIPRTFCLRSPPTVNFSSNETSAKLCPVFYFFKNFVDSLTSSYKIRTLKQLILFIIRIGKQMKKLWSFKQSFIIIKQSFIYCTVFTDKKILFQNLFWYNMSTYKSNNFYSHWRLISCRV